jgi:sodium/potassium/calcium exchanger 6
MERPLLRDIVFYLAAGFWAFYVYWKQEIRLYDSLGFLGLYVVYIVVVLVGRYIHNRTRNSLYLSLQKHIIKPVETYIFEY